MYPCAWIKYRAHSTTGIASSTPTSLFSVELRVFIFCFLEKLIRAPFPRVIPPHVCPLQSQWTPCDASICHFALARLFTVSRNLSRRLPLRYCSTLFTFPQSSSSGALTLVVRIATAVWMSLRALHKRNSSWATL